ncbi:hypothetical protein Taro_004710 [Colocasia esculenta]|uniref:Transposase (putative) gypsy type domain-containing protein n=1 Tax=Colocasia esculenta TaxID=4460 RepID=A0A843TVR2_COLES|nr:hypothetical protein [Colocasia esculenta]
MAAAWSNSSDSESESISSEEEEEKANLAFMANIDEKVTSDSFTSFLHKLFPSKTMASSGVSGSVGGYGTAFLTKNGMGSIVAAMDRLKWTKIATLSEVSYPDLIKAFYVCLKTEEDGTLTSMVKGTQIRVTRDLLASLFGVTTSGCSGVHTVDIQAKGLGIVGPEYRLKDVPRSATFSTCTKADSDLMFWAIQNQSINTTEIILERMKFASAQHYGISVVGDISEKMGQAIRAIIGEAQEDQEVAGEIHVIQEEQDVSTAAVQAPTTVEEAVTTPAERAAAPSMEAIATAAEPSSRIEDIPPEDIEPVGHSLEDIPPSSRVASVLRNVLGSIQGTQEELVIGGDQVAEDVPPGHTEEITMEDAPCQGEQEIAHDNIIVEDAPIEGEQSINEQAIAQGEHNAGAPIDDHLREGLMETFVREHLPSHAPPSSSAGPSGPSEESDRPSGKINVDQSEPSRVFGDDEARPSGPVIAEQQQEEERPSGPLSKNPAGPPGPIHVENEHIEEVVVAEEFGPAGPAEDASPQVESVTRAAQVMAKLSVQEGRNLSFHIFVFKQYPQGYLKADILAPILSECERLLPADWEKLYTLSAQQLQELNASQARSNQPLLTPGDFLDANSLHLVWDSFMKWEERYRVFLDLKKIALGTDKYGDFISDQRELHIKRMAPTMGPSYRIELGAFQIVNHLVVYEIVSHLVVYEVCCLLLSVDHLEAGFRLPLPEVAKALLNTWGVSPIQLTPNTWRYICIFGVVCKLKEIRGSADVFRAHFKLSASRASGADIYYAKHRTDRMHIGLSNKYSNNKGWMDRLFFVRHRGGAEWGFPTVIRPAQKDSFPKLIQDEARASDALLRAGVRNGEGYVTEFMLVKYGLNKPWTAAELEAGRDEEANDEFAEQIPVLAHRVYEDDDVAAVVRVPSAVRVGAAVTTALVAPPTAEGRPSKAQALEKGPGRIRLKKKATKEVVPAGARTPREKDDQASRPSAKKRPVLVDESAEEAEQLRARKKQKAVQATPPCDEEGTEEEEDGAQLLLRRKSRAVQSADEGVPRVASTTRPEVAQKMATELGLIFVSEGSESPAGGEAGGSTCARDREPSGASNVGGAERGAPSNIAEVSSRKSREVAASPVRQEEDTGATGVSAPAGVVSSSVVATAPTTILSSEQEVVPAARATAKAAATARASEEVATSTGGILPPMPPSEVVANAEATSKGAEGTGGEAAGAAQDEGSEDDRRPLSEALLKRPPGAPSVAALEATLRRMEEAPRELPASPTASRLDRLARCLELPSEQTPEKSVEGYHPECLVEDGLSDVDVEALADEISKSLGTPKALAIRGQRQKYLYEAQTAFCDELSARHKAREAALEEEVKNLKAALQAARLDVTLARAEKDALAKVMMNAKARAVADYKAGSEYKEDLEQYGARCYRVGLNAGKEVGEQLSWVERAREAFEAAVRECRHRTQDARLDGVRFAQFQSGRMPPSDDDAGPSQQAP